MNEPEPDTFLEPRPLRPNGEIQDSDSRYWINNLIVVWIAQFTVVVGFSFVFPFIPLFVLDLGVTDPGQAALWAGISGGAMGLTMFIFGPIWGMLGDRFGRKKNVLRAIVGGGTLLVLSGFSADVYQLTLFRLLSGVTSGTFAPAMALVASTSPRDRIPFCMGALQSAMFLGSTIGPLFGGVLAESVGFRGAFFVAGGTVLLAGILVLIFAREDFRKAAVTVETTVNDSRNPTNTTNFWQMLSSKEMAPLLGTIFVVQFAPTLLFVVLPVLLNLLSPGSGAPMTGIAFAILGVTAAMSSYVTGWISNHVKLTTVLAVSSVGAGVFYLPLITLVSIPLMFLFLGISGLFQGAMLSSTSGLLGLRAPSGRQGAAFGALQSVSAAAFGLGPFIGGVVATTVGLRAVPLVQALTLFVAAGLVVWLMRGQDEKSTGRQKRPRADR